MKKDIRFWHLLLFVLFLILFHLLAVYSGAYTCVPGEPCEVYVDNIAHVFGGVCSGLFVLWLVQKTFWGKNKQGAVIMGGVVAIALLWELIELSIYVFFPDLAAASALYSPNVWEAGEDVLSNVVGGGIYVIWKKYFY